MSPKVKTTVKPATKRLSDVPKAGIGIRRKGVILGGMSARKQLSPSLNSVSRAPTTAGTIFVWGNGDVGQLGLGDQYQERSKPFPLRPLAAHHPVDVAVGSLHNLALTKEAGVHSWGVNDHGALGRPISKGETEDDGKNDHVPGLVPNLDRLKVVKGVAGDNISLVLTDQGKVYGWGTFRGADGVIGFSKSVHTQTEPVLISDLRKETVVDIACGADHILALTAEGHVWSWGDGSQMQLGRRVIQRRALNSLKPERVGVKNIKFIGCGGYHSFAVDNKNRLWAWGLNNFYQCGLDNKVIGDSVIFQPTIVDAMEGKGRIVKVDGGEHHTIILMENGDVYSFGRGDSGELGIPEPVLKKQATEDDPQNVGSTKKAVRTPMLVERTWTGKIVDIDAGGHHNLALVDAGQLWGWGYGDSNQLANVTGQDEYVAILVTGQKLLNHRILRMGAGAQHSVCLAQDMGA